MSINNIKAGSPFPEIVVPQLNSVNDSESDNTNLTLGEISADFDWKMIIVYRGKHCPMCTDYLKTLNNMLNDFKALKVEVAVVSADSKERAEHQIKQVNPDYAVGYDLSIEQMKDLGLFISIPRNEEESDRPFAEPGLYLINDEGLIQLLDVSNAPFARPDLATLLGGISFIKNPDNNYPIRGTYQ